ncbi:MAG: ATP-dependent Clp protease proteolytic subunit [Puniceicoccales bacterium]|nr:ATP-dependent Clp protease proteolytic subunit [Puniceicoccales bacterium]
MFLKSLLLARSLIFSAAIAPFSAVFAAEDSITTAPAEITLARPSGEPEKTEKSDSGAKAEKQKKQGEKNKKGKHGKAVSDKPGKDASPSKETPPPAKSAEPTDPESIENKALQKELARLTLEKNLIEAKLALAEAQRRESIASERAKIDQRYARTAAENAAKNEEKSRIESDLALQSAKATVQLTEKLNRVRDLEIESKILKSEQENALVRHNAILAKINAELSSFQKKQEISKIALKSAPKYLKEPLVQGTLYISDRRIPLNGVVTRVMSDYIIERINFFNNQNSEQPIFIVIDRSPGGSVSAGFQILKAMESSKAPVYVVVKGYAASMAAVITTLAERSYAYNNTIILHHQMSTMLYGNMSDLEDQMKVARQWYSRLATAVSKKMGVSLEEFTKQMYVNFASGDWEEFGDHAKKLKWVNNIVDRIIETSVADIRPTERTQRAQPHHGFDPDEYEYKLDDGGRPYIQLPLLDPFDAWWIYDKRNQYRAW